MKTIVLGDTHGRNHWEDIVKKEKTFDKIIFMGDYFDTKDDIPVKTWIKNFENICDLKSTSPDDIIMLFGNHDYHYMRGVYETYSGFKPKHRYTIEQLIDDNKNYLQMCHVHLGKYMFTHAGVTKTWYNSIPSNHRGETIEQTINDLFKYTPSIFRFTAGRDQDPYGDEVCQTPIWVRPDSLEQDAIENYTHVVGHTTRPITVKDKFIYVDSLFYRQYLVIEDNSLIVKTF